MTEINEYLKKAGSSTTLRIATAGSVDDGKSTLIGRLLYDSDNILEDQLESVKARSKKANSDEPMSLALVTDGLKAEQEQGITIDVAYRYFSTEKRCFILADSPGHEQYTRNMATGASTADVTIILIDAKKGITTQTKRHAFISSLLGVRHLLVAVNKMDLVDFSEEAFQSIEQEFSEFASKLRIRDIRFVPVSALLGDNIVNRSENMNWFGGEPLLEYLENVYTHSDKNFVDFRFPVQGVIRAENGFRGYTGQIASGAIKPGEEILVYPALTKSRVKSIETAGSFVKDDTAIAGMSVALTFENELDVSRGDMIVRPKNLPIVSNQFEAMLVWMHQDKLQTDKQYLLMHTTKKVKAIVDKIEYKVDVNTLSRSSVDSIGLNEIARVKISTNSELYLDPYERNRHTGSFIVIDPDTLVTIAAGMILPHFSSAESEQDLAESQSKNNLHDDVSNIVRKDREKRNGHKALTFWFTGLSGSGKSTLSNELEKRLFKRKINTFRLDGDTLRSRLNNDLGFSPSDRRENLRRTAEVARLINDAGQVAICSFISPLKADREFIKAIIGEDSFIEIFVDTSLKACEERDPHGLYKKARAGEIPEFTGVTSPYEKPENPDIRVDTEKQSLDQCVELLLEQLLKTLY